MLVRQQELADAFGMCRQLEEEAMLWLALLAIALVTFISQVRKASYCAVYMHCRLITLFVAITT